MRDAVLCYDVLTWRQIRRQLRYEADLVDEIVAGWIDEMLAAGKLRLITDEIAADLITGAATACACDRWLRTQQVRP